MTKRHAIVEHGPSWLSHRKRFPFSFLNNIGARAETRPAERVSLEKYPRSGRMYRRLAAILLKLPSSLVASLSAAADYRQTSEFSDRELKRRGLSRTDIPRTLHQRHFASLAGWLDNLD